MKLVKSFLTKNPCYTANRKITVKGLMLHSVGCPQPNAKVFVNNWNSASFDRACVHGFIDANDGTIYQTLPWNHRGWHGGGSSNNTHIGVEMCEPSCIKYTSGAAFTCSNLEAARKAATTTYNAAVELFAYLCKEFNLNPLTDICSHREGHKKGIASNHGDPEHLWNQLKLGYTMDGFRKAVKAEMEKSNSNADNKTDNTNSNNTNTKELYRVRKTWKDSKSQLGAYKILDNAIKACKDGYSVFDSKGNVVYPKQENVFKPYTVKVTVDALNIRAGAGTNYSINGCIRDHGIYTIVAESDGWGKLKSGAGWISLYYTKRIS